MIIFGHFLVDKNMERMIIECPSRDDIKQIQHFSNYTVSIETANLPDATIYLASDINHNVLGLAALVPFNKEIMAIYKDPNNTISNGGTFKLQCEGGTAEAGRAIKEYENNPKQYLPDPEFNLEEITHGSELYRKLEGR